MELFIGALVSLIVDWTKKLVKPHFPEDSNLPMYTLLAVVALVIGAVQYYLATVNYWESVAQIVVYASAFWALIGKHLPEPNLKNLKNFTPTQ